MFSEREEKIIKIIGRKKITISDIDESLFTDETRPLDSTIHVANSVSRIIEKCEYHKLNWTLEKNRKDRKLYVKRTAVE